jgi:hypothetical protein
MLLKGGSPAIHKLGNIGRKQDAYIQVTSEDKDNYIGMFREGFGFADVKFPKYNCRLLTEEEISEVNNMVYTINGHATYKLKLDSEGNFVKCHST